MNNMKNKMLGFLTVLVTTFVASSALADDGASAGGDMGPAFGLAAAALGMSIAAFGGALGQGRAAAAALEGIARNPSASDKLFTPMILGLALIESLVIYALVISYLVYAKF